MAEESTAPDLVELTRETYEALSRCDFDALVGFFAADVVYDLSDVGIGTFEGAHAVKEVLDDWWGPYSDFRADAEDVLDLGQGVVYSVVSQSGRPVGGEGRVEQRSANVALWVSSRIEWFKTYLDPEEARAAAERLARERADG